MDSCVINYLQKKGYSINSDYYSNIENWIAEWKGQAEWLDVKTVQGKKYPMYSLGMAKRSCEDLASIVTSEPFTIKAKKSDKLLKEDLLKAKVLKKLPTAIEIMGYSGTVATVTRIVNAETDDVTLKKTDKTKIKTIDIKGNQIIPLTIEDDEVINCAFVSKQKRKIDGKNIDVIYLELHELEEKGYQITNVFFNQESGQEITVEGIVDTYNTLSDTPLFSICKLPKVNIYDNNNGLGMAIYGDSEDQLQMLDLVYNNFGMDFKLGQKIMVINKKLVRTEQEEYTDKEGNLKTRTRVVYPTDVQKQLFTEMGTDIMSDTSSQPYIYEYNPDLRVGDNKEGIQFALDNFSFKLGYGTHYYSFENGNLVTATEAVLSRQDFVSNGRKVRECVNEYLLGICRALLSCERMLGTAVDEKQDIEIEEVDGFLEDDETQRQKLLEDVSAGLISKTTYLKKVYKLNDDEIVDELERINNEDNTPDIIDEDIGE